MMQPRVGGPPLKRVGTHSVETRWFRRLDSVPASRGRLFCFPFAGGSAHAFADWVGALPEGIELWGMQPPGRGARISEAPVADPCSLLDAAYRELRQWTDLPYTMVGHSMGGRIAYELAARLRAEGEPLPSGLVISGTRPAYLPRARAPIHALSRAQFFSHLRAMDGMPAEVFDTPELLDLLEPALRADFRLVETWDDQGHPPLPIPIYALGGRRDPYVSEVDLGGWSACTRTSFDLTLFEGGHFFINESQRAVLARVRQIIVETVGTRGGDSRRHRAPGGRVESAG